MFLINKIEYKYFDCFISIDIILPTHILAKKIQRNFYNIHIQNQDICKSVICAKTA